MTFIKLTAAQADSIRGNYGPYAALDPIPLDGSSDYILTDAVLSDPAFASVKATIQAYPTYPAWQSGTSYSVGNIVEYQSRLWRVIQAHTSQTTWQPPNVPALFVQTHKDGEIPNWRQPLGAHDAWPLGAKVRHSNKVWQSLVAANVWEPGTVGTSSLWQEIAVYP
jgi:chitodextrinase